MHVQNFFGARDVDLEISDLRSVALVTTTRIDTEVVTIDVISERNSRVGNHPIALSVRRKDQSFLDPIHHLATKRHQKLKGLLLNLRPESLLVSRPQRVAFARY